MRTKCGGFVDDRFGDRGEDEHRSRNDTVAGIRPSSAGRLAMRIWVDLTNSPHVLVMRPVIELLRDGGHEVRVTARDFAQTLELCERFARAHGDRPPPRRAPAREGERAWRRARRRSCGGRARARAPAARFDIALGHGSNDVTVAAALLRVPSSTMFDYEWAKVQHHINCRLARAVVVPDAIPPRAPATATARAASCARTRA